MFTPLITHIVHTVQNVFFFHYYYYLFFQGVTLTDLKEAERSIVKINEPQNLSVQPVSPNITVTPAERGESYYQVCVKHLDLVFQLRVMTL